MDIDRISVGGRKQKMFGIDDPWILLGYGLAIGFTLACVVYGWWKRDEARGEE